MCLNLSVNSIEYLVRSVKTRFIIYCSQLNIFLLKLVYNPLLIRAVFSEDCAYIWINTFSLM